MEGICVFIRILPGGALLLFRIPDILISIMIDKHRRVILLILVCLTIFAPA